MAEPITAPRGTHDIAPSESAVWQLLENAGRNTFARYGYQEIRTPIFESTDLFSRGIGTETDIVGKEMYTFTDRSDRSLTLRPEGTAGVVRAFLEHKLYATAPSPLKLWYVGPMFRYERPQKGRQRQFHQIGVEVFGSSAPGADAEAIALAYDYLRILRLDFLQLLRRRLGERAAIGLEPADLSVEINSLGDETCRPRYRSSLQEYFRGQAAEYCADCSRRIETNPLRVLDCKVSKCKTLNQGAPALELCESCQAHFEAVRRTLDSLSIPVVINSKLVRGLDYYSRTVFEIVPASGQGKTQGTICAGGRYDKLVEQLGGPATPAVGWALGEERVAAWLIEDIGQLSPGDVERLGSPEITIFIGILTPEAIAAAMGTAIVLRRSGVATSVSFDAAKPDKLLRQAIRLGARYLALIGPDELESGQVKLKDLETREQRVMPLNGDALAESLGLSQPPDLSWSIG